MSTDRQMTGVSYDTIDVEDLKKIQEGAGKEFAKNPKARVVHQADVVALCGEALGWRAAVRVLDGGF